MGFNLKSVYQKRSKYHYWYWTLFCLILTLIFSLNNIVHFFEAKIQTKKNEEVIREYSREIQSIDSRIETLQTNRDSLEKFAREKFFFSSKGEDVFIVKDR